MTSPDRKAADLRSLWGAHKGSITGEGAVQHLGATSPGKLPAGQASIVDDPRAYFFGSEDELCKCCGALNRRGDGTACTCGHVSALFRPAARRLHLESIADHPAEARSDHMSDFVNMLREGAGASQRRRGVPNEVGVGSDPHTTSGADVGGNDSSGFRSGTRAGKGS